MPPKAKSTEALDQTAAIEALTASVRTMATNLEAMSEQLAASSSTISNLSTRLSTIETLLKITQAENTTLKEELVSSAQEATTLKAKLNHLEQHHRSWSVRVTGIKIPADEETDPNRVKHHLYEQLLKPILQGAVSNMILPTLPGESEIIERAHVLPAKKDAPKPIIARFYSRDMRALIFKLKKEFAPRETLKTRSSNQESGPPRPARLRCQIYDDLTRTNFLKMKAIGDDSRVDQCWSANGHLKFKLVGSQQVRSVSSVFASLDEILSK